MTSPDKYINYSKGPVYIQTTDVVDFVESIRYLKEEMPNIFTNKEGIDPFDESPSLLPPQTPQVLQSPLELLKLPGTIEEQAQVYSYLYELVSFQPEANISVDLVADTPINILAKEFAKMAGILKDKVGAEKQEEVYEALKEVQEAQPIADTNPVQAWEDTFNTVLDQNRIPNAEPIKFESIDSTDQINPINTNPLNFYLDDCFCKECVEARSKGGRKVNGEYYETELAKEKKAIGQTMETWKDAMETWKQTMEEYKEKTKYPRPLKSNLPPADWNLYPKSTATPFNYESNNTFTNPLTGGR